MMSRFLMLAGVVLVLCSCFLTKTRGVVEREVVHDSGTKETPPEQEILSSLLHWATVLLPRLIGKQEKMGLLHTVITAGLRLHTNLDDFVLHDRVQPFNEGLHCGVLPQQLLQLLENSDGIVYIDTGGWRRGAGLISLVSLWGSWTLNSSPTLRVDVWVLLPSRSYTEERLRADAAQIHAVNVQHHVGHHSLVKQRWTCYLQRGHDQRIEGPFTQCCWAVCCCIMLAR